MALSLESKRMVSEAQTTHADLTAEDFTALINHRRDVMIKAIVDHNDALEGLQALAGVTPPDEPGVADLGDDTEVITRLVTAARDFKRINATVGSA